MGAAAPSLGFITGGQPVAWIHKAVAGIVVNLVVLTGFVAIADHSAGATAIPAVGVQFHATWGDYNDTQRIALLDKLAAANIRWVRIDLGWRAFEENGK